MSKSLGITIGSPRRDCAAGRPRSRRSRRGAAHGQGDGTLDDPESYRNACVGWIERGR
jgi:hypothetical protein